MANTTCIRNINAKTGFQAKSTDPRKQLHRDFRAPLLLKERHRQNLLVQEGFKNC